MFIYLKEKKYVENWLNEGIVPINLASYYRDQERNGNRIPDKNLLITIKGDEVKPGINSTVNLVVSDPEEKTSITIIGNIYNSNKVLGVNVNYNKTFEDGLALFMSTELNLDIMKRFKEIKLSFRF